jgi:hypothetical protein
LGVSNRLYISLDEVKRDWLSNLVGTDDYDDKVLNLIREVSKDIEEMCKPHSKLAPTYFVPVTETRSFDHPWDTDWLKLDQWLLSVATDGFKTKNGATTVAADSYYLMKHDSYNESPFNAILMKASATLTYTGTPRQANSILGSWGYCEDTRDTGAVLDGALNDSDEAFDVDDGSLIEAGWMLLVGSEQMCVKSRSGHRVWVEQRGDGGTTAASHLDGATISWYVPPRDITKLAGISVARLYHRGTTAFADTTGAPPGGLPYVAANVPDALMIINRYRREKWW